LRFDKLIDPSEGSPENRKPRRLLEFHSQIPEPRNSTGKILVLVVLLMAVIYAMIEAGKPERWYWLIPPEQHQRPADPTRDAPPREGQAATGLGVEIESGLAEPGSEEKEILGKGRAATVTLRPPDVTEYPAAARDFWERTMRRLSSQQRVLLFMVLKRIRHFQDLSSEERANAETLMNALHQQRLQFHQELMHELTYTTEGSEKKAELANALFESETVWDRAEWPALRAFLAREELSADRREGLAKLQAVLDPLVLKFVVDRSAQGWEGDSPAWGRLWEQVLYQGLSSPLPVTHLELSAQPGFYRGRFVAVRGWVRGAWREALPIRELGMEHLYVMVVRPEDSKITPFYIYLHSWPADLPAVGERFTALNQRIAVDGLFFKIRTYRDTENQIQQSPMILAKTIHLLAEERVLPAADINALDYPAWSMAAILTIATMAVAIAWFAFRVTRTFRFRPGPNRTREIHRNLAALADDPEIKTDKQRIRDLYD
jgi:hypothetical protein